MYGRLAFGISILFVVASLQGCAGMADAMSKAAGMGVVTEEKSTFDGATVITMAPTYLYSGQGISSNSIKLGARWNSKAPDHVTLIPSYNSTISTGGSAYVNLSKLEINIDGEIASFTSTGPTQHDSSGYNTVARTIYTESKGAVVVPWSALQKMMSAADCRVRIVSSAGYEDSVFSMERIPGGPGTAKLSLKEFVAKVEAVRVAK